MENPQQQTRRPRRDPGRPVRRNCRLCQPADGRIADRLRRRRPGTRSLADLRCVAIFVQLVGLSRRQAPRVATRGSCSVSSGGYLGVAPMNLRHIIGLLRVPSLSPGEPPMPFKALGLHPPLVQANAQTCTTPSRRRSKRRPSRPSSPAATSSPPPRPAPARRPRSCCRSCTGCWACPRGTTQALVVTPTRELAQQIDDVCLGLAYHTPLRGRPVVGGAAMGPQEKALRPASSCSSPRRAGCWTTCGRTRPASTSCTPWSSTRPTACSTWASCPTSSGSSPACRPASRRCSSRRPCRR